MILTGDTGSGQLRNQRGQSTRQFFTSPIVMSGFRLSHIISNNISSCVPNLYPSSFLDLKAAYAVRGRLEQEEAIAFDNNDCGPAFDEDSGETNG